MYLLKSKFWLDVISAADCRNVETPSFSSHNLFVVAGRVCLHCKALSFIDELFLWVLADAKHLRSLGLAAALGAAGPT